MPMTGPTRDHHEIRHWAETNGAVPVEVLPQVVDSIPAMLRLMTSESAKVRPDIRKVSWEDFFAKFDQMGLAFVYDSDATGYNEILQVDAESPYRHPSHQPAPSAN